jgi:hypothetical protein
MQCNARHSTGREPQQVNIRTAHQALEEDKIDEFTINGDVVIGEEDV